MSNLYKNSVKNLEKRNSGVKFLWSDFWFLNIRRMNKAMESNDEQWWTFDSIHTNLLKSGVRKECRKVECQVNSISIIFLINTALNCIKKLIFAYQKRKKKWKPSIVLIIKLIFTRKHFRIWNEGLEPLILLNFHSTFPTD